MRTVGKNVQFARLSIQCHRISVAILHRNTLLRREEKQLPLRPFSSLWAHTIQFLWNLHHSITYILAYFRLFSVIYKQTNCLHLPLSYFYFNLHFSRIHCPSLHSFNYNTLKYFCQYLNKKIYRKHHKHRGEFLATIALDVKIRCTPKVAPYFWSRRRGSNPRPQRPERCALPAALRLVLSSTSS